MERLCRYLEREKDRFETVDCDDLDERTLIENAAPEIRGRIVNTAARYVAQAWNGSHDKCVL